MIDFGWESQTERLKRHMSIPPKRKLQLLYQLNCFTKKYSLKKPAATVLKKSRKASK